MRTFAYPFGDCALNAKAVIDRAFEAELGSADGAILFQSALASA